MVSSTGTPPNWMVESALAVVQQSHVRQSTASNRTVTRCASLAWERWRSASVWKRGWPARRQHSRGQGSETRVTDFSRQFLLCLFRHFYFCGADIFDFNRRGAVVLKVVAIPIDRAFYLVFVLREHAVLH